ncbi:MAG: DNA gyrase inhibitor YacG [Gammaproteobacteria bacterium]|nr:DNA gyrase inhibitor YacG [Gammaproteobacteria bacterium]
MKKSQPTAKCPTCKNSFRWDQESPWRPFCSERCRLIDLGEWLDEGHRIKGDPEQPSLFQQSDD